MPPSSGLKSKPAANRVLLAACFLLVAWHTLQPPKWKQYFPLKHVNFYHTTRCHIPEVSILHSHCCENLRSNRFRRVCNLILYKVNAVDSCVFLISVSCCISFPLYVLLCVFTEFMTYWYQGGIRNNLLMLKIGNLQYNLESCEECSKSEPLEVW
jgi:hypothetical protein